MPIHSSGGGSAAPAPAPTNLLANGSFETFTVGPPYSVSGWLAEQLPQLTFSAGVNKAPGSAHSLHVSKIAGAPGYLQVDLPLLTMTAISNHRVSLRIPVFLTAPATMGASQALMVRSLIYFEYAAGSVWYEVDSQPLQNNPDTWQFLDIPGIYIPSDVSYVSPMLTFGDDVVCEVDVDSTSMVLGDTPIFFV